LTVSSDAKDSEGLKLGSDYKVYFKPDIPFLNVIYFHAERSQAMENLSTENFQKIQIDYGTGEFFFFIRFSLPFSAQEKQNTLPKITLSPFFPRSLPSVALQYASWIDNDILCMCWVGLSEGNEEIPHYYKLTIPGGRGGIRSGMGIYMKEDITIYLEAVR